MKELIPHADEPKEQPEQITDEVIRLRRENARLREALERANNREEKLESVSRAILEQFWGQLPTGYDWKTEATDIRVFVSDSNGGCESVWDMAQRIVSALPNV
jgi:predicted PP-loop superfamily ATPase